MNRLIIAILPFLFASNVYGQVGTWHSYTDMKEVQSIALMANGIVAASSGGLFIHNNQTGTFSKYTNIDGLASIDLSAVFTDSKGRIFVGAEDGYINLYDQGSGWTTIPDIARTKTRPQRGITVINESNGLIYFGTEFGIVVYDPDTKEFKDTYSKFGSLPIQTKVNDIFFRNDSIWVATAEGIGVAYLHTGNLQDPANWGSFTSADGLSSNTVTSISELHGNIAAGTDLSLCLYDGSLWTASSPEINSRIVSLENKNGDLYVTLPYDVMRMGADGGQTYIGEYLRNGNYPGTIEITSSIVSDDLTIYIGTNFGYGYTQETPNVRNTWTFVYPNGPNSNHFLSLSIDAAGNLWSASGRDANGYGFYMFDGTEWTNYTTTNTPELQSNDVYVSAASPNGDMWFGSWGKGLLRRSSDGVLTVFNSTTMEGFPGIASDPDFATISGIAINRSGVVYSVHNGSTDQTISRYSPDDNTWRFYSAPLVPSDPSTGLISIDEYGNKWFIMKTSSAKGLFVFTENGTLDDQSDDDWTRVASGSSQALIADEITAVVVDGYGDVWVGTDAGIRTIFNPLSPSDVTRTCYNTRCNIEGESITCLAVDPVNNKWIGTSSGVYILSNDGSTIIDQYDTDNSPLLDNHITSIAVHPETGVVYIGTNKGLSAVSTAYQEAQDEFAEIKVFPNPFVPKEDGELNIKGLVEESSIKILSASGNLVTEFVTPGGNIGFWDGKTSDGKWAPTGVYYIAAYSSDGKKTSLSKVAVINK